MKLMSTSQTGGGGSSDVLTTCGSALHTNIDIDTWRLLRCLSNARFVHLYVLEIASRRNSPDRPGAEKDIGYVENRRHSLCGSAIGEDKMTRSSSGSVGDDFGQRTANR